MFGSAFRETLFRFRLTGAEIARKAGLTPNQVSAFQNGRNLRIDSVEKLLKALPSEARAYLLELVLDELQDLDEEEPYL